MHETYTVTGTVFRETDTVGLKKRVIGVRYGPGLMQPGSWRPGGTVACREQVIEEKETSD
jgi:hypothetical protein